MFLRTNRQGLRRLLAMLILWLPILVTMAQDRTQEDFIVQIQVERQYNTPAYEGKRQLDFNNFLTNLNAMSTQEIARLDRLILEATIPALQALFANGDLTSEQLTLYYLYRIRTYDVNGYNTILQINPDALMMARQRDEERATGNATGALHGIPVLLKDNIGTVAPLHTTAGTYALRDAYSDRDAFIVQQLLDAGAIILGKTNLSELANWMTIDSSNGFSVLGGQTRNAYGRFDVAGSSSGSASAVALNFASVAIGTETSGSLISPASQNSVASLKPSLGLVSRDRIIPITDKQDTAGPMTRTITDLAIVLNVIAGVDVNDPKTSDAAALADVDFRSYLDASALQGKRIAFIERTPEERMGDEALRLQAIADLEAAGAEVVRIDPLQGEWEIWVFFYGMHAGINAYLQATGEATPFQTLEEIVLYNEQDPANRAPWGMELLAFSAMTPLNEETAAGYERIAAQNATNMGNAVRQALAAHNADFIADLGKYSSLFYAGSGFPAITIPAGYRADGEPLGITLYADYLSDAELIAAAYAYEQQSQHRKPPTLVLP